MTRATHWRFSAVVLAVCLVAAAGQTARAASFAEGERAYLQQDYRKSLGLLTQLARQGHPKAQYLLGRQYQFGQGTAQNYVLAYYWYSRAEKKGHVEAGLFRHLLVSKRGMTEAQVAEAKKLLGHGGKNTLAAAKKVVPAARDTKKPEKRTAKAAPAKKRKPVKAAASKKAPPKKKSPKKKSPARTLARKPVKAPPAARQVARKSRKPAPYATAVIPNRDLRPRSGWTNPDAYRNQPCASCQNDGDPDPGWRNRARPRPWADRGPDWRHPRFRRYGPGPRFHVPRYVYRLPPWQRRQWLRQHRWRVMNDPFYRRAWRAYRRYQHQYRRW